MATSDVKGREVDYLEIGGFDPAKKTHFSSFLGSDGTIGHVAATFAGNKVDAKYTSTTADGKIMENRIPWTFGADLMSVSKDMQRKGVNMWVGALEAVQRLPTRERRRLA
jgi:hypothetical protein